MDDIENTASDRMLAHRTGAGSVPRAAGVEVLPDRDPGVEGKGPKRYYNVSLVAPDGAVVDKRTVDAYELEQELVSLAGGGYAVFSVEAGVDQGGEALS